VKYFLVNTRITPDIFAAFLEDKDVLVFAGTAADEELLADFPWDADSARHCFLSYVITDISMPFLREHTSALLTLYNRENKGDDALADRMAEAISGLLTLALMRGLICVDIADIKTVLATGNHARFYAAKGKQRDAMSVLVHSALCLPDHPSIHLHDAKGMVVNVVTGAGCGLEVFSAIGEAVEAVLGDDVLVVLGWLVDFALPDDEISIAVTVVSCCPGQRTTE